MQTREEIEHQRFEDLISVLLSRLHSKAPRIHGTNTDGCRLVQIVHGQDDQVVHASELKSFTSGIDKTRPRLVARSLKLAKSKATRRNREPRGPRSRHLGLHPFPTFNGCYSNDGLAPQDATVGEP